MIKNVTYDEIKRLMIINFEELKEEFTDPEAFRKTPSHLQKLILLRFYNASTAYNLLSCNLLNDGSKRPVKKFLKEEIERLCHT